MLNKLLILILGIFVGSTVHAAESVNILIEATVGATCSVSASTQTVQLGTISISATPETIGSYAKPFELTAVCPSGSSYKYGFSSPSNAVEDGCLASPNDEALLFCLTDEQTNKIEITEDEDVRQFEGKLENGTQTTVFRVVPALSSIYGPIVAGYHQGHLLVNISID